MKKLFTLYSFFLASLCAVLFCGGCSEMPGVGDVGDVPFFTITYETNGGSYLKSQRVEQNTSALEPNIPTKANFSFAGWYSDSELTAPYSFASKVTSDITLYAKWSTNVNTFVVTFESNGGSVVDSQYIEINTPVTEPAAPKKGDRIFAGWYSDITLTQEWDFSNEITKNITLYAKWVEVGQKVECVVTFETNGGSYIAVSKVESGSVVDRPTDPIKSNNSFAGWYADKALTEPYNFAAAIVKSCTIYAKWEIDQYKITFDCNGGSAINQMSVDYNTAVSEPTAPTKKGYIFAGWYTDPALIKIYDFSATVTANFTLYAMWQSSNGEVPDLGVGELW